MTFDVYMEPRGKARPRFVNGHAYKEDKDDDAEEQIRLAYQCEARGKYFDKGVPIYLWVTAYFAIPKSMSRKNTELALSGRLFPTKKPDGDNILKLVADALNKVAYYDDSQIVEMKIIKLYAAQPHINIAIEGA